MELKSNIRIVIARLEELQAGYPAAIRKAIAPEKWTKDLISVAEKTLHSELASNSSGGFDAPTRARLTRMVPAIVGTIIGVARPDGSLFRMWLPPNAVTDINLERAAKYTADTWTPSGRAKQYAMPNPADAENLQAARDAVLEWVTKEKERDERDMHADGSPLSNEEIAERVEVVLGLRPRQIQRKNSVAMREGADSLRGAVNAWLSGEERTPGTETPGGHEIKTKPDIQPPNKDAGLSGDQARQWLGAVLAAWVAFVRVRLRDRIEVELKRLHAQVKTEQPNLI